MLLPTIGEAGQGRLRAARVLLVGCGALGTVIADGLVRAGVGRLTLIDRDIVERTNLHRQVLFDEADAEAQMPKAEAARLRLERINGDVEVVAHAANFDAGNAAMLGESADLLIDGTDNYETRLLLNDLAVRRGVPLVYGGAVGTAGTQYTVLPHSVEGERPWEQAGVAGPCLRCLIGATPAPGSGPTCDTAGVLGPVAGQVAQMQVIEAIKVLVGDWAAVERRLRSFDAWKNQTHALEVAGSRDPQCPCCVQRRFDYLDADRSAASAALCGRNAVQVTPSVSEPATADRRRLDFAAVAERLAAHGRVDYNRFRLQAELPLRDRTCKLTLFADGRAIVHGTTDPTEARNLYARYVGL